MHEFSIKNVNVYSHPEQARSVAPLTALNLYVRGLQSARLCGQDLSLTAPHLILLAAGDDLEYVFGPDRENWMIQMDYPDIHSDKDHP